MYGMINEMCNLTGSLTGLGDVVIWVGKKPPGHGHRIKVSNVRGKMVNNNFTITIPDYNKIGKCELSKREYNKILEFIKLNEDLIKYFSSNEIDYDNFCEKIKPV